MSYAEQLRAAQQAGLARALENYAARCDRLATAPCRGYEPDEDDTDEEEEEDTAQC